MHILKKIKLQTSNNVKAKEFEAMGITVIDGDIREVHGEPNDVAIHKALSVDPYIVVEDSIVYIDGNPIVDWKYTYAQYAQDGVSFDWHVNLSYHDGTHVMVFNSVIDCVFVLPDGVEPSSSNFDSYSRLGKYAQIDDRLLSEVKTTDLWRSIDPRSRAIYDLTWGAVKKKLRVDMIPPWSGDYQE